MPSLGVEVGGLHRQEQSSPQNTNGQGREPRGVFQDLTLQSEVPGFPGPRSSSSQILQRSGNPEPQLSFSPATQWPRSSPFTQCLLLSCNTITLPYSFFAIPFRLFLFTSFLLIRKWRLGVEQRWERNLCGSSTLFLSPHST